MRPAFPILLITFILSPSLIIVDFSTCTYSEVWLNFSLLHFKKYRLYYTIYFSSALFY